MRPPASASIHDPPETTVDDELEVLDAVVEELVVGVEEGDCSLSLPLVLPLWVVVEVAVVAACVPFVERASVPELTAADAVVLLAS